MRLLDTSVAILLRDLDPAVKTRVAAVEQPAALSVLTVVELEGGVVQSPLGRDHRRKAVDAMLEAFLVLPFGPREAEVYGRIVGKLGFSRPKIIDRMIAAQAIAADATLITLNPRDFRNIAELRMEDWS